jgi:hypothetical protein
VDIPEWVPLAGLLANEEKVTCQRKPTRFNLASLHPLGSVDEFLFLGLL